MRERLSARSMGLNPKAREHELLLRIEGLESEIRRMRQIERARQERLVAMARWDEVKGVGP